MASILYPSEMELQLRLGFNEHAILTVVRHWAWWTRADVEGQVPGDSTATGVVLTANREADQTIREILRLSFQLEFPEHGGEGERMVSPTRRVVRARGGFQLRSEKEQHKP
jgi:hypothetical protein